MSRELVSHFEIIRKLGEGGMGVVYQARDLDLDRMVALKFLPAANAAPAGALARFRQEARAISVLNHPHIATIYGIEDTDDASFLILEYLPGGTLREKLSELQACGRQPSARQVVDWMIQVSQGLAHAHRHGIVHRDIKASNLLFNVEGQIKIADFGLAKVPIETGCVPVSSLTQSGVTVGTLPCMSPEQAQGQDVDKRSDLFSLGILCFELLAGSPPFHGSNAVSLLHEIVCTPAPQLSEFRPALPAALQPIVSKLLAKDPGARYQSADELLADLEPLRQELESGSEQLALQVTATLPGAGPHRSRGARLAFVASLAAALSLADGVPKVATWIQTQAIPAEKRIAVLPFTNIGPDPRNQALVDGLMEVVSNSLSRLEQPHGTLLVVPATEIRKEQVVSGADALKKLGANLAITGSVERKSGNSVEVMINLDDTRTRVHLRTDSVKTSLSDAALSDSVVAKIARMLDLAMQPQDARELKAGGTQVPDAGRYYVEGLGYLRRDDRIESIDKALQAFHRAAVLDSGYVLAHTGAAEAYCRHYQALKDAESIDAAFMNSSRAIRLNSHLAPVHITMGMVHSLRGDYEGAENDFKAALKLDPRNADAYRELAATYEKMGRADQAETTFQRAVQYRPGDWLSLKQLGVFYFHKGRFREAAQFFLRVTRFTPDSAKAYSNLGAAYRRMGRNTDAAEQFRKSIAIDDANANAYANLGYVYYFDGHFAESANEYEKATELSPGDSDLWGDLADAYRAAPGLEAKAPAAFRQAITYAEKDLAVNPRQADLRSKEATYLAALSLIETDPALAGRYQSQARSAIASALQLSHSDKWVQFRAALVYEQVHQRDLALQSLKSALASGFPREEVLKDPPLADLRKDPHFLRMFEPGKPGSSQTPPHNP